MKRCIPVTVALVVLFQFPAKAAEPEGANVLKLFEGAWQAKIAAKPSKWSPDGAKETALENSALILNDQFVVTHSLTQPGGVKGMWLMKYDAMAKNYPAWFFNSKGLLGGEWAGTWSDEDKTLTFKMTDAPTGWTSSATNRFPDGKSNEIAYWIKDDEGSLLISASGKKERQADDDGKKIMAQWAKIDESAEPLSAEAKVMQRLVGSWDVVSVSRPAEWTPEEVRMKSKVTREWIMNKTFVMDTSKAADGKQSIALFAYDPTPKVYRSWWFNSEGYTSKSTGKWNADKQMMSFVSEPINGLTSRGGVQFVNDDKHIWTVVVTDDDGKKYFDTTWTVNRSDAKDRP